MRSEASFTGGALIFSNTGSAFRSGTSPAASLAGTDWLSLELDLTLLPAPYDPSDMRFLGVIIGTISSDPPGAGYTFYVDTFTIEDAP